MAKSAAERAKEYRSRKKKQDPNFLLKDAARKRKTYVKREDLPQPKLLEKRIFGAHATAKWRSKKTNTQDADGQPQTKSARLDDGTAYEPLHFLTVKIPAIEKRKRAPQAPKLRKLLKDEREKTEDLQRHVWRLKKKLSKQDVTLKEVPSQRAKIIGQGQEDIEHEKNNTSIAFAPVEPERTRPTQNIPLLASIATEEAALPPSPAKTATNILRGDGLSPSSAPTTRKTLSKYFTLVNEINTSGEKKKTIIRSMDGKHVRKGRLAKEMSEDLKVDRRLFSSKKAAPSKAKKQKKNEKKTHVINFLTRPDHCMCLPDKKSVRRKNGKMQPKYVLKEYLQTLHKKYVAEFPERKMHLSVFTKMRPSYIQTVKHLNRKVCLCRRHQNFALMMKALKIKGTPDTFIEEGKIVTQSIKDQCPEQVKFQEWVHMEVPRNDKMVKKIQLVDTTADRESFLEKFEKSIPEITSHIERATAQYVAVKDLKENLPEGHVTAQLDFAENWAIKYNKEISAAFFSKDQVTLHPVVIHYKENNNLMHKSFVVVSDETSHAAGTVFAILKATIPEIKKYVPELQHIHYISDSPVSQYRNSSILALLSQHKDLFDVDASWTYYESGHGKGPCDGVGAASKHAADDAVNMGSDIKSAQEYYSWGKNEKSEITYIYVGCDDVAIAQDQLQSITKSAKKVSGIMAMHAVVPDKPGSLHLRDTSCFKSCCFASGTFNLGCKGWRKAQIFPDNANALLPQPNIQDTCSLGKSISKEDEYVAAKYCGDWFLAKVLDTEPEGTTLSFLWPARGKTFNWPPQEKDILTVPKSDILLSVSDLTEKNGIYRVSAKTRAKIIKAFKQ